MHIDEILNLIDSEEKESYIIPKQWAQGRTVYGGLSACIAYKAACNAIDKQRPIRSMSCNFVAPFTAEKDFIIDTEILREGGNVSTVQVSLVQDEQVCVRAQFIFGAARKTKINVSHEIMHTMPLPKKASFVPNIPGLTPQFLKHFDLNFVDGGKPFTGSKNDHIHGWMRFTKPSEKITHAHLIALIDAWPPTLLQKLRLPAPGSTMTWTLNFVNPLQDFSENQWFAYQADTLQYSEGYGIATANVWDSKGQLLAISIQNVTVFA